MARSKSLALAVAFSLLFCGCSRQQSPSHRRSHARRSRAAAPADSLRKELSRRKGAETNIVQAGHVEVAEDAAPFTAGVPKMLDEAAADRLADAAAVGHRDASLVLEEALAALRTKLTVIGHNLANVDTLGFKRSRVTLETRGYQTVRLPGAQDAFNNYAPTGIEIGRGCRIQSVAVDFRQGPIEVTNRELDVAIDGDGFFQLLDPTTNEFVYTRAGNFAINANGILVVGSSNTGRVVQPQISIPVDTLAMVISADGNVSIQQAGQMQYSQIGQLQLAKFLNPEGLLKLAENLYQETLSSGAGIFGQPGTNGLGRLQQNALERSNVDLDEEILAWKSTQRMLRSFEHLNDGGL